MLDGGESEVAGRTTRARAAFPGHDGILRLTKLTGKFTGEIDIRHVGIDFPTIL